MYPVIFSRHFSFSVVSFLEMQTLVKRLADRQKEPTVLSDLQLSAPIFNLRVNLCHFLCWINFKMTISIIRKFLTSRLNRVFLCLCIFVLHWVVFCGSFHCIGTYVFLFWFILIAIVGVSSLAVTISSKASVNAIPIEDLLYNSRL